jgi:hypothetical protein
VRRIALLAALFALGLLVATVEADGKGRDRDTATTTGTTTTTTGTSTAATATATTTTTTTTTMPTTTATPPTTTAAPTTVATTSTVATTTSSDAAAKALADYLAKLAEKAKKKQQQQTTATLTTTTATTTAKTTTTAAVSPTTTPPTTTAAAATTVTTTHQSPATSAASVPTPAPPTPPARLVVSLDVIPDAVSVGSTFTYTVTVANRGGKATTVTISDTLPAALALVGVDADQGSCDDDRVITCTLGSLRSGDSATVTIAAQVMTAGPIVNAITVAPADPAVDVSGDTNSKIVAGRGAAVRVVARR